MHILFQINPITFIEFLDATLSRKTPQLVSAELEACSLGSFVKRGLGFRKHQAQSPASLDV